MSALAARHWQRVAIPVLALLACATVRRGTVTDRVALTVMGIVMATVAIGTVIVIRIIVTGTDITAAIGPIGVGILSLQRGPTTTTFTITGPTMTPALRIACDASDPTIRHQAPISVAVGIDTHARELTLTAAYRRAMWKGEGAPLGAPFLSYGSGRVAFNNGGSHIA